MLRLIITPSNIAQPNLVKLDILLNAEPVDALAALVHQGPCLGLWQEDCEN